VCYFLFNTHLLDWPRGGGRTPRPDLSASAGFNPEEAAAARDTYGSAGLRRPSKVPVCTLGPPTVRSCHTSVCILRLGGMDSRTSTDTWAFLPVLAGAARTA